jgi:hypothetical protein
MWKIFRMAGALVLPWLLSLSADAAPLSGALRVADQYRSAIKLKSHRGELCVDRTSTYPANFMQWNRGGDCFRVSGRSDSKLVQVSADDQEEFSASTGRFAPLKRAEGEQMSTYNTLLAYSDAWDDEEEDGYGFYRFDPFSAVANRLRTRDELNVNGGGTYIGNDEYFCTIYEVADGYVYIDHFIFNTATWLMTSYEYGTDMATIARDLAYDPDTGLCYGTTWNHMGTGYAFSAVDPHKRTANVINSSITEPLFAITFDTDGNLWGVGSSSGKLYSVDKSTGAMTEVGETGLTTQYVTGGTYDPLSGKMLVAVMLRNSSSLYAVDLQTAEATKVYDYPNHEEVVGPYAVVAEAADDAPAAPEGLDISFPNGALTGTISFSSPSETFAGSDISGQELSYTIKANGQTVATGTVEAGDDVITNVTLETSGTYLFVAQVANAAGKSPRATTSCFIGEDVPELVPSVTASYDGSEFEVEWEEVTESQNGGYIDLSKVAYKVVRYCNDEVDEVVEAATTSLSVTDEVATPDEMATYMYVVYPVYNGQTLQGTASNRVAIGPAVPDLYIDFRSEDNSYLVSTLDHNNDGSAWKWTYDSYYVGMMAVSNSYYYNHNDDDYLITVPIKMEAGREYNFETKVCQSNSYCDASYEVLLLKSKSVTDVASTIVERTTLSNGAVDEISVPFSIFDAGTYYIALHCNTTQSRYGLCCYYINVTNGPMLDAPYAPNFEVTTASNGDNEVTGKVTTPTMSVAGDDLTDVEAPVTRLVVCRDNEVIYTNDNPASGATYSFTDSPDDAGEYTYVAYAVNSAGEGYKKSITTYVGVTLPATPTGAYGHQTSTPGEVKLSWNNVTTDIYGSQRDENLFDYALAKYTSSGWQLYATDIVDNPYTFTAAAADAEQDFQRYLVLASSEAGMNYTGSATGLIAVGAPYETPYVEMFGDEFAGILGSSTNSSYASWGLVSGTDNDGNNQYLRYGYAAGDVGRLTTGLIKLTCTNPELRLYAMTFEDCTTTFDVEVNCDGEGFTKLASNVSLDGAEQQWKKFSYSLSDYAGKTVEIAIVANIGNKVMCVDDISLNTAIAKNLIVKSFSVPETMSVTESYKLSAVVYNDGNQTANAEVQLYCNGECIQTKELTELAANESTVVAFDYAPGLFLDSDSNSYYVKVVMDGDENEEDNESARYTATLERPTYPVVTDLSVETSLTDSDDWTLQWSAPELEGQNVTVNDDVESYPAFSIGMPNSQVADDSLGDWTGVCACEETVQNTYFHAGLGSYPNYMTNKAMMVVDPSKFGINYDAEEGDDDYDEDCPPYLYLPHSGNQFFAMYDNQYCQSNDYMISPRLSGKAQTVSFYAQTFWGEYGEQTIEFMISKSGKDIDDFEVVDEAFDLPVGWTLYEFELPEGTNYFAIHNISDDIFALFIDDITFETPSPYDNLEIEGYNVYSNGEKLNDAPVASTSYIVPSESDVDRTFYVTVVYNEVGESDLSNAAVAPARSGLQSAAIAQVKVVGGVGEILVSGADGNAVNVYSVDGKLIANKQAAATTHVRVPQGIYLVAVSGKYYKVIVR